MSENKSIAMIIAELPEEERNAIFEGMTEEELEALKWDWKFWGRPNQFVPEGPFVHVALAGRGFGKTRAGSEFVRDRAMRYPGCRIALVGRTASDTTGTIIFGESGIMEISPESERPEHKPSKRLLEWPNGSQAMTFSSQEPSQLRGPQFHFSLSDELGSWLHTQDDSGLNAWDNLRIATRLAYDNGEVSSEPQIFVATTPKRVQVIEDLNEEHRKNPHRVSISRGSTYDNVANLSSTQLAVLTDLYEGTEIGRQELMGEMLEDMEGVLWTPELLDEFRDRSSSIPHTPFKIIAVDPSVSEEPTDECGILVLGSTTHSNINRRTVHVLEDLSIKAPPQVWAKIVAEASARYNAPVVVERNQGGELVPMAVHAINPNVRVFTVWAAKGKRTRAEPALLRYMKGRVRHWGYHPLLETQMTTWDPEHTKKSPDRVDALVWGVTALLIKPPKGLFPRKIRARPPMGGSLPGGIGMGNPDRKAV